MSEAFDDLVLGGEFPATTHEDWLKLTRAALKGVPLEGLTRRNYDSLLIAPLAPRRTDAAAIIGRAPAHPRQVMQRVDHPDATTANAEARHDLENGATGLSLIFADAIGAYGFGLPGGAENLARALDGIIFDAGIALDLDLSTASRETPLHLAAVLKRRGIDPATTQIRCGLDPFRSLATQGTSPLPLPELGTVLVKIVTELTGQGFKGPFVVADGRVIHNAGGSEAQELAYVVAAGVAYLRMLEAGGIPLDAARRMLYARLSADADQFLTMAKFRALRKLWARVEEACGLAPTPLFIAAETAWRMLTKRDPHVNILRSTIATAAAGLGGADAITVLPFTLALGLPDRFARRVARNTQLILLDESNLAKVADPAAGSGSIEALTDELCLAAWEQFQKIEASGGAYAALASGLTQRQVAGVREARAEAIAGGREKIVGTTIYPNPDEVPAAVLDLPQAPARPADPAKALTAYRLSEEFET